MQKQKGEAKVVFITWMTSTSTVQVDRGPVRDLNQSFFAVTLDGLHFSVLFLHWPTCLASYMCTTLLVSWVDWYCKPCNNTVVVGACRWPKGLARMMLAHQLTRSVMGRSIIAALSDKSCMLLTLCAMALHGLCLIPKMNHEAHTTKPVIYYLECLSSPPPPPQAFLIVNNCFCGVFACC